MAHEILSVKLCELDDSLCRLHSRIHLSEAASHEQLQQEIRQLQRECNEAEAMLRDNLRRSKSGLAAILKRSYGQIEEIIEESGAQMRTLSAGNPDEEVAAEEQILLAEYALDFAHRAADRALLLSMEAIDTQLIQQKEGEVL